MLAGLADGVDAALFIGYHGKAGTARSVLAHTIQRREWSPTCAATGARSASSA